MVCFQKQLSSDPCSFLSGYTSFLIDRSTSSTFTRKLNLDSYLNIENIRSKNPNRLIIAWFNINFTQNKFGSLAEILESNFDILLISETKLDSSFPTAQFKIEGYTTYRLDRNSNGVGMQGMSEKTYLPHC